MMTNFGLIVLLVVLVFLSALLIRQVIHVSAFISLGVFWLIVSFVIILGPETISEFSVGTASVKRDALAARQFRDEAQEIRDGLRGIAKNVVESSYILASESFLAISGESAAKKRLEKNLSELSKFAEPAKDAEDKWWNELRELYLHRHQNESKRP